jgi:prolyl oligopeptidase
VAELNPASLPSTRRDDVVDVLHGIDVADPYRWLESGDDPEVVHWVAAQNAYTRQALDARPDRGQWHGRLAALVGLPTVLGASLRGDRLFVIERARDADQYALVLRSATDPTAPPRMLLDPAGQAVDAAVAIDWYEPSPDGSLVALGLSEGGTESSVLHVLDVDTATFHDLRIPNTRASSIAWQADGAGFWYARYPEGDDYHRHIARHRLGDDPAKDAVVFDRLPTPESWPDASASPDGRYLLVEMLVGWGRIDAHLLDLATGEWTVVIEGVEAQTSLGFDGDRLIGVTTHGAPNGRIVTAPLASPDVDHWTTLVAERTDEVLGAPRVAGGRLLHTVSRAAVDSIEVREADGSLVGIVDGLGLVAVQGLVTSRTAAHAFAVVASFDAPISLHRIDGLGADHWAPELPTGDELPSLTVTRHTYESLDGTEIGLFLVHRADVVPGPDVPLVLNGYGGFAISESPTWMPNLVAWCGAGGVWAIAGLRGGYEHGEAWHRAGRRGNKQHVFDDFHAAGDWLVAQGLASPVRLAAVGGSNGGLLVGAALTQRPELFRAVWCAVPLLDMVRFPQFLIARLWTDEYGDPEVPEELGWVLAYSPYHHVEDPGSFPAVLFTTAEGDTRVDPLHARKMAALLQHAAVEQDQRPILLLQAGRAGHGVGKPASMRVDEGADVLSFLWWQLVGASAS